MASSSQSAVPADSALKEGLLALVGSGRHLVSLLGDVPVVARYVGHLTLLLLLILVTRQIFPRDFRPDFLPRPRLPEPAVAQQDVLPDQYIQDQVDNGTTTNGRYLVGSSIPLTVRVVRDILPMTSPQRAVRTGPIAYQVQAGDTPLGIAQKYGIKGTTLLWSNPKLESDPDFLQVGQELVILPIDGAYHAVAKNETLESIASKYKVDVAAVVGYAGNGVTAESTLEAGQQLVIPGGVKPIILRRVVIEEGYQAVGPEGANKGSGQFGWPMSGQLTQRSWSGHVAIDLATRIGTPVYAADAGYVALIKRTQGSYGLQIVIDHGNGYQTRYAHLSAVYVEVGQSVSRGEKVAASGNTGRSTGPHLHFEVIENGVRVNPLRFLQ